MKSILLIDDSQDYRVTISTILLDNDYDVVTAACPKEAFERLFSEDSLPDLIVCDLHMPFTTGTEMKNYPYSYEVGLKTIHEFRESFPEIPVIAITATAPHDLAEVTRSIREIPTLCKPFHHTELMGLINSIMDQGMCVIEH